MAIERLPARRPRAILEELDAFTRDKPSARPVLTAHLLGGQMVTGTFIAFDPDPRQGASMVLQGTSSRFNLDAIYVAVESIAALTVHHTPESLPALSRGRIAPSPADAPGRLVIDRQAAELARTTSAALGTAFQVNVDWDALGTSASARAAIAQTLTTLEASFIEVLKDELGKTSLRGKADALRFILGASSELTIADRAVRVGFRRHEEELFAPEPKQIDRALKALL